MSEAIDPVATESVAPETDTERKRRRLRPNEVSMLRKYISTLPIGTPIQFSVLPDIEMKRALFPSSQLRLVEKELLRPTYNEETGILETVTIDPDMLAAYDWDLKAPEPKVVQRRDPDEQRFRKPRGRLNNDTYRIQKISATNPKRPETHGWYNWEHCYLDGMTIPEYLSRLDYPRDILVDGKFGKSWFNGPDPLYLNQDFKAGHLGIYDSSKSQDDPEFWLKPEQVFSQEEFESPVTSSENDDSAVVAESGVNPAG